MSIDTNELITELAERARMTERGMRRTLRVLTDYLYQAAVPGAKPPDTGIRASVLWEGPASELASPSGFAELLQAVQTALALGHLDQIRLIAANRWPDEEAPAGHSPAASAHTPAACPPAAQTPPVRDQAGAPAHAGPAALSADGVRPESAARPLPSLQEPFTDGNAASYSSATGERS